MPNASDDAALQKVKRAIMASVKNDPEEFFRQVMTQAIEEVIDGGRTGRFSISELASTEKTYIGTKVEILTRSALKMKWGDKLDLKIAGEEVDVKNTTGKNWMIPREAVDEICLLLSSDEETQLFSVGLLRMKSENLNMGANQDGKRSVSAAGKQRIEWLVLNKPFPKSFLASLPDEDRKKILEKKRGQARVTELLRTANGQLIPRIAIETLAQQKDPMKRVRSNGGAQDKLKDEGIVILIGKWDIDRRVAREEGLPVPGPSQIMSFKTTPLRAKELLKQLENR